MRRTLAMTYVLLGLAVSSAVAETDSNHHALPSPSNDSSRPSFADPPMVTRQTAFNIPFTVPEFGGPAVEVQLYVSTDQGENWNLYARQTPSAGHFSFRATQDGQYWFASRTLDAQNRKHPSGPLQPELRVVVDTTQPQLEFTAKTGEAGEVITSWSAYDKNLDVQSLKIEYQAGSGAAWKPVAVDLPRDRGPRRNLNGRSTWWPEQTAERINVRAEVRDAAGNSTVVVRQVKLGSVARGGTPTRSASTQTEVPEDPFADTGRIGSTPWPVDNLPPGYKQLDSGSVGGENDRVAGSDRRPYDPPRQETTQPGGNRVSEEKVLSRVPDSPPGGRQLAAVSGPRANQTGFAQDSFDADPPRTPPAAVSLPAGVQPEMTRARRFHLDYDVDAVGPEGVAEVELWATRDGGRTWSRWGRDEDKQSPIEVEVDQEGVYGFRIVVIGKSGLASRAPQAGDLADLWVVVDQTPPETKLLSAEYGKGENAGRLLISWRASDPNLLDRPVTLKFSDQPDGPWTTIAAGLPNEGQYQWPADPRLPDKIYVRVEVRDAAGNVGIDQLREPLSVRGLTPRGRIRSIRPLDNEPRDAAQPGTLR